MPRQEHSTGVNQAVQLAITELPFIREFVTIQKEMLLAQTIKKKKKKGLGKLGVLSDI